MLPIRLVIRVSNEPDHIVIVVEQMIKNTTVTQRSNHYSVLRTIEDFYGLEYAGLSKYSKSLPVFKAKPDCYYTKTPALKIGRSFCCV
ncbi:hypothetical protein EV294_102695 [Paenibacillus sp. BK033]|nr:hypothetical protein EV294_102695 [Paenibacillus sp. BK033]